MTKFLLSLVGFGIAFGLGVLVMIHGWGLQPVSLGWIIGGGVGSAFIGALFSIGD